MYSAYKLSKQGDNIQPWCTPFLIWNQSIVPCLVLTITSWPAYRFLRRQVRSSGIPMSWRVFHISLWSTHSRLQHSHWSRSWCCSGTVLLFLWSSRCWQFDLLFLRLSYIQLEHLKVLGSHAVEALLGEFRVLLCWHVKWVQLRGRLNVLWHCPSLGLDAHIVCIPLTVVQSGQKLCAYPGQVLVISCN